MPPAASPPPIVAPAVVAPATTGPASEARQVLFGNLAGLLFAATQRRPPRTLRLSAGLADPGQAGRVLIADLVIAAGPAVPGRALVADPLVVVELLGLGNEAFVRQVKLPAFRALPGCRELVLIQDDRVYCEVHRLLPGGRWITDLMLDRDARLHLETAGIDTTIGVLYSRTGLVKG
jgi:Uma2 family endonuclease